MSKLTIEGIIGGPLPVWERFATTPNIHRNVPIQVAGSILANIAKELTLDKMRTEMRTLVEEAYDMYVLLNGTYEDAPEGVAKDDWESGIDDAIEAVIEPYDHCLSANWTATHVIDTRFHRPVKEGAKSEFDTFAGSFADEIWKVLIHFTHTDDTTGEKELRQKSAWQILSSVGIMKTDVEEYLAELPALDDPQVIQQPTQEAKPMATLQEVLSKIYAHCGGVFDRAEYMGFFELARDDDDGIAVSGIQQMGGDLDDCEALRMFAMTEDEGTVDAKLCDMLAAAGGQSVGVTTPAAPVTDTDEDAELAELMGDPLDIPPFLDKRQNAPAPTVPPITTGAPPAPAKAARAKKTTAGAEGAIPPEAFQLIRTHIKMKDDELAAGIGVSRQTLINYSKDKAKATFVPTPEAKQFLLTTIAAAQSGLAEAFKLVNEA